MSAAENCEWPPQTMREAVDYSTEIVALISGPGWTGNTAEEYETLFDALTHAKRMLDGARECWLTPCMRAWHPLRFAQAQKHCDEHGCGQPVMGRFLPDPTTEEST